MSPFIRDELYPANWPEIVEAGEDCWRIEGTFENKGVVTGKSGQIKEVFATDLFGPHYARDNERFEAMRAYAHVTLSVEPYTWPDRPDAKRWRLVITPSPDIPAGASGRFEEIESIGLPRGVGYPFVDRAALLNEQGHGFCVKNTHLVYSLPMAGGPEIWWHLRPAHDGSLVIMVESVQVVGMPYLIWPSFDRSWARFGRVP